MNSVEQLLGFLGSKAKLIRDTFARHQIEYMFIGKGAAIAVGFTGTTRDLDVYPDKSLENRKKLVDALHEIGFEMSVVLDGKKVNYEDQILSGADFIQLRKPFDLDVIFAPDGFENYTEAEKFKIIVDEYPLMNMAGIIRTKKAAGRKRDKIDLPLLQEFKDWLDEQ